jgi:hypothetical protein
MTYVYQILNDIIRSVNGIDIIGKLFERPTIETEFTPNNFGNGARTQERAIES